MSIFGVKKPMFPPGTYRLVNLAGGDDGTLIVEGKIVSDQYELEGPDGIGTYTDWKGRLVVAPDEADDRPRLTVDSAKWLIEVLTRWVSEKET